MLVKGEAAGGRGIQGQGSWQLQAEVLCGAGFWPRRELFPGLAGVRGAESITSVSHCRYLKNLTSTRVTGNLARAIVPLRSLQRFQSPLLLFAVVIVAFSGELEMLG